MALVIRDIWGRFNFAQSEWLFAIKSTSPLTNAAHCGSAAIRANNCSIGCLSFWKWHVHFSGTSETPTVCHLSRGAARKQQNGWKHHPARLAMTHCRAISHRGGKSASHRCFAIVTAAFSSIVNYSVNFQKTIIYCERVHRIGLAVQFAPLKETRCRTEPIPQRLDSQSARCGISNCSKALFKRPGASVRASSKSPPKIPFENGRFDGGEWRSIDWNATMINKSNRKLIKL